MFLEGIFFIPLEISGLLFLKSSIEIYILRAGTHWRRFRIQLNKIWPSVGVDTSSGIEKMSGLFDEVFICVYVER